jgi:hypothetical protein
LSIVSLRSILTIQDSNVSATGNVEFVEFLKNLAKKTNLKKNFCLFLILDLADQTNSDQPMLLNIKNGVQSTGLHIKIRII